MKQLENASRNELMQLYKESIKAIKSAKTMFYYINKVPDDIFENEFRNIVIDALNNNAYISCEYDYSAFDKIDYYTLVDKKTKKVIKKYPVDADYNGNDAKEDF